MPSLAGKPRLVSSLVALAAAACAGTSVAWRSDEGHARAGGAAARPAAIRAAELQAARQNVFRLRRPWAVRAWRHTLAAANAALAAGSNTPDLSVCERSDVACWQDESRAEIYGKGIYAGIDALALAQTYAIGGDPRYARRAAEIMLDWARVLSPPLDGGAMFHYVAYPVGALDKFFLAYDLIRGSRAVPAADRRAITSWFRSFVPIAQAYLTNVYERPWDYPCAEVPGSVARYSNAAAWALSLGALAAAATNDTESWNWFVSRNRMRDGGSYTWRDFVRGAMLDDGKMLDECARTSLAYGLYTLVPLTLVAEAGRLRGERLYDYVAPGGHSLKLAWLRYAPYLSRERPDPYATVNPKDALEPTKGEYNADAELAYRQWPVPALERAVAYRGAWGGRGDGFDGRALGFASLFGRDADRSARPRSPASPGSG